MIDCAIHNAVPSIGALTPYLSDWWRDYIAESGFAAPEAALYPARSPLSAPLDALPPSGAPPGSDLDLVSRQILDPWAVERGILCPLYGVAGLHNEDLAAALAAAVNEWQRAEWLDRDPRLRASIVVPGQSPIMAVAEIDRLATDRRFVQVLLPLFSESPYGKRRYWPIYAAAERHSLPVAIVAGDVPPVVPTPAGSPTFHIEEYAAIAQVFQSQVLSLVSEGVFVSHPLLRTVLVGSGCTWLPPLLWRFDKDWRGLRREVPWLARPPSDYVRDHIRLTLHPFDAPPGPEHLLQFVEWCGSADLLLWSSAYPHWHPDAPDRAVPRDLPPALRQAILEGNARATYPRLAE